MNTQRWEPIASLENFEIIRTGVRESLHNWLQSQSPEYASLLYNAIALAWMAIVASILHLLLHRLALKLIDRAKARNTQGLSRTLYARRVLSRAAFALQGAVAHVQAQLWLSPASFLSKALTTALQLWMLLFGLLTFYALLDALQGLLLRNGKRIHFPLRGITQTLKIAASVVASIIGISLLMGESPLILLSGLGALSAVLMLVFKDPILGLVAGIQLSANNMLSVGDWLEMPKYGADGNVIDIGLTTVKVQNWDKTITTIPTYALISDSFKNWRGMSDSGGRRIKRNIHINTSSIAFLDEDTLQRLRKAKLLAPYLEGKLAELEQSNSQAELDLSSPLNGRRLTNVGTFRGYLKSYLKSHPRIAQEMLILVRQLESSNQGLPLQIYAFTATTKWGEYEDIQSDIFDHIFAVLPEFGLRIHEAPTGHDLRTLSAPFASPLAYE
ncbi:mechanosensitive ion channel family protein [Pelagicoccus sp. SDUM812005]|uniref:mechanosensitive ion channel family protein n=1 Tax=Pelagicoccus sp. SDUM812005 TaxID=3041257 RepID=UPI00280FC73D|nr:mechanosensitive ion channel family protein [Pelagicoccus sp. SDUM812005]MDQ8183595.1 mechanosensitive ion channel family protein [Pelagicoccus sp. SDUM812005]